jgi:hypothetical protein
MAETQFTWGYMISLGMALFSAYIMQRGTPNGPAIVKFLIIPMVAAYLTLQLVNFLFPHLNEAGRMVDNYFDNRLLGTINNSNYIQVFPPILIVFVLTLIVLFKFV